MRGQSIYRMTAVGALSEEDVVASMAITIIYLHIEIKYLVLELDSTAEPC